MKKLSNVFIHSKNSTIGLRQPQNRMFFRWTALIVIMLCTTTACTPASRMENQLTTPSTPAVVFAEQETDRILVNDSALNIVERIPVHDLHGIAAAEDYIYWIESPNQGLASIYQYDLSTQTSKNIYSTQAPIGQLSVSPVKNGATGIAFVENDDLFVLDPSTGLTHLVHEHMQQYQWSPEVYALLIPLADGSGLQYLTLHLDGSVASTVIVADTGNADAIVAYAFQDSKTVIALVRTTTEYQLHSIDLRTSQSTSFASFSLTALHSTNTANTSQFQHLSVSPDAKRIVIQQYDTVFGATAPQAILYDITQQRLINIQIPGRVLQWTDTGTIAILTDEEYTGSGFGTLATFNLDSDKTTILREHISYPSLIPSL